MDIEDELISLLNSMKANKDYYVNIMKELNKQDKPDLVYYGVNMGKKVMSDFVIGKLEQLIAKVKKEVSNGG